MLGVRRRSDVGAILGRRPNEFAIRLERAAQCLPCFGLVIVGILTHDHLPAAALVELAAVPAGHVDGDGSTIVAENKTLCIRLIRLRQCI